jgi:excisionase family DNA binding protein
MRKQRPNARLVKIHRNYAVEDAAKLLGVHKNTIRAWIKQGLPLIDSRRPVLILGAALQTFLQEKRVKNKRPCKPNELYCLRCRAPKRPAADMVELQAVTEKLGNLLAICPDCSTLMHKRYSLAKADQLSSLLDITFTQAHEHIVDTSKPTVNSDFK